MKKLILLVVLVLLFKPAAIFSQEEQQRHFAFDFGLGGAVSSFQDRKFSDVHWAGTGFTGKFDFSWHKKGIHAAGLSGIFTMENPKTFDNYGRTKVYRAQAYYSYVYPVKVRPEKKCTLYLGSKVELADFSWRFVDDLINNSSYFVYGIINILAYSNYERQLNNKWTLNAQLGFQVFSAVMSEEMSFTYVTSQNTLLEGKVQYDEVTADAYPAGFWDFLNIETNFNFRYGKRWMFGYSWRMQQSFAVKNYPMIQGYSALTVAYRIISKVKKI